MFTPEQKRNIANALQTLLEATGDPDLPTGEIRFDLHVHHKEEHRLPTIIRNNSLFAAPSEKRQSDR